VSTLGHVPELAPAVGRLGIEPGRLVRLAASLGQNRPSGEKRVLRAGRGMLARLQELLRKIKRVSGRADSKRIGRPSLRCGGLEIGDGAREDSSMSGRIAERFQTRGSPALKRSNTPGFGRLYGCLRLLRRFGTSCPGSASAQFSQIVAFVSGCSSLGNITVTTAHRSSAMREPQLSHPIAAF
jgi:hypothetical protein